MAARTQSKASAFDQRIPRREQLVGGVRSYRGSFADCAFPRVALVISSALYTALAIVALLILRRPLYIGLDSLQSYAHVEYLSHALVVEHRFPLHMDRLESGAAMAMPYAAIPWIPDALLYETFGDRVVGGSMIAGAALLVAGWLYFRPQLRHPALLALLLANPYFWDGLTEFQIATFWSFAFFLFGAGLFERGRLVTATALFLCAFAVHPLMGGAALALYLAATAVRQRSQLPMLAFSEGVAVIAGAPFALMFLAAPVARDTQASALMLSAADDLQRLALIALPMLVARLPRSALRYAAPLSLVGVAVTFGWFRVVPPRGLWESPEPRFGAYLAEHPIESGGGSYRVMTGAYHEDGMLEFLRAGATLSGEFFTESEHRSSFGGEHQYACFLASRHVGRVVLEGAYLREVRTNEREMAERLVAAGDAEVEYAGPDGTRVYRIAPGRLNGFVRECGT